MVRGYENTQRVIQFMDAKAGAVVALSLAIFAFVGKVSAWAFEKSSAEAMRALPGCLACLLVILGIGVLVCGFISLNYAFWTVRPNHLPDWGAFSTLFPAHSKDEKFRAEDYLKPVVDGVNRAYVIDEFRRQLLAVGEIVHRKINWLRTSIQWLWWQGLVAVVFSGVIWGMGIFGKIPEEQPKPAAAGAVAPAAPNSPTPAQPGSPVK
jgi:hypothetical protein